MLVPPSGGGQCQLPYFGLFLDPMCSERQANGTVFHKRGSPWPQYAA